MAIISFKVVNKKKQQVHMAKSQTWQDPNKHVIASRTNYSNKHGHIHHQTYTSKRNKKN